MTIEITMEQDKWIRADLIDGNEKTNLFQRSRNIQNPLLYEYQEAASHVHFNYPQYKNVRVVTDIGSSSLF